MATITYYTRDSGGAMTRKQAEGYDNLTDFFKGEFDRDFHLFDALEQGEEVELKGWPESKVTWYGDVGIGE